jgi:FKBP-type peptidyl-prolyl cis-trans isomerase SlyD
MVVTIEYKAQLTSGEVVDSSEGHGPLVYLHGHRNIISGLESALTGMEVGESKEVDVPPEKAYGEHDEDATMWIPRDAFPSEVPIEEGVVFEVQDDEGRTAPMHIREVEEERVLGDYNHPLAGETLHFTVEVLDIRPATEEEIAHDHVHQE